MKRIVLVLSLLLMYSFPAEPLVYGERQVTRVLSLKVLQERLKSCTPKGNCPDDVLKLCGLTRIEGYILDEPNNDLILFGEVDTKSPPLHTENLIIALRNTWLKYAELKGNT
ncbi:hypothetical protein MUO65_01510 [bacterium]|nr:hypothetical protein [bacterium]